MTAATVIVPSYQRPRQLEGCLAALVAQDHPDFEVIVVDDGSPEPLAGICARFAPRVRCIRQENTGPAQARNRGAEAASAGLIAFTDDDCRPEPDWLRRLQEAHGGLPDRLVGGHVVNDLPDDPYASASQAICDYLYDHFGAAEGRMPWFTGNNIACLRERFFALGGFDPVFRRAAAEDRDFGMRWRDRGGALVFAPEARVRHRHASSLGHFLRHHAHYGNGAYYLRRLIARSDRAPIPREPVSFYLGIMLWPLRQRGWRGLPMVPLMALSQLAMVYGFIRTVERGT